MSTEKTRKKWQQDVELRSWQRILWLISKWVKHASFAIYNFCCKLMIKPFKFDYSIASIDYVFVESFGINCYVECSFLIWARLMKLFSVFLLLLLFIMRIFALYDVCVIKRVHEVLSPLILRQFQSRHRPLCRNHATNFQSHAEHQRDNENYGNPD